jgi:hypothetical protein
MNNITRGMTKTTMPSINRNLDGAKHKLLEFRPQRWKRVKTTLTSCVQEHLPSFSILDKKEKGVKLDKSIIVKSKLMN